MVYHVDLYRAHAQGGAGGVDGGVAAADYKHLVTVAHYDLVARNLAAFIEAHTAQEAYGLAHTGMIDAGDGETLGHTRAGAHEDGVEAAAEKVVDSEVLAHGGVEVEDHAEILYLLDLAAHHLFGQAVLGDAVHEHATRLRLHLENLHGETLAREVAGYGEAGRPAAYHGDAATRLLGYGLVCKTGVGVEVGHEALELAYVDVRAFLGQHAVAFALALVAAYAAAHSGEVAAAVYYLHGVSEVAFCQLGNPVGDVVAYRASLFAAGHLAVQTSLGLTHSFGYSIAFGNFLEIIFHSKRVLVINVKTGCCILSRAIFRLQNLTVHRTNVIILCQG